MATHAVLHQDSVMAYDVGSLNRSAVAAADLDNGNVFYFSAKSTTAGEGEVWTVAQPATGSLTALWMAYSPEISLTTGEGGSQYKGLSPDPQDFYNASTLVFDAFSLKIGDLITVTADALAGTKSTNTFVEATDGSYELTWAAAISATALSLKLRETTYISIADGSIGTQRVTAYQFEVVFN